MKKLFAAVFALALTASLLTGCRGNVSDHENGRITDPTMMPDTIATMPSTDTVPSITTEPTVSTHSTQAATRPSTSDSTESTTDSGSTENGSAPGTKQRPRRSMG